MHGILELHAADLLPLWEADHRSFRQPTVMTLRPQRMAGSGGLWTFAPDFLRELSDCAAVVGAAVRKS
jgi:hypothetical protein